MHELKEEKSYFRACFISLAFKKHFWFKINLDKSEANVICKYTDLYLILRYIYYWIVVLIFKIMFY